MAGKKFRWYFWIKEKGWNMSKKEIELKELIKKKKSDPETWLNKQLNRPHNKRNRPATHIGKYTHPDANVSITSKKTNAPAGYLYFSSFISEINDYNSDNATNAPYPNTLESIMPDGKSVREHLETNSPELKKLANVDDDKLEFWKTDFENYKSNSTQESHTDQKLKQVFFPIDDEYILLTLLPCSILIWELKDRVQDREWDENQDKKYRNAFFRYIQYNYGGTQPINVSFMNSKNSGHAIKLTAFPPSLNRKYKLPNKNFFDQIRVYGSRDKNNTQNFIWRLFDALYRTIVYDPNTLWARKKKQGILMNIIEHGIIAPAETIKMNGIAGWSQKKPYATLPSAQKKWLDPEGQEGTGTGEEAEPWQDVIAEQIARFIENTFEKTIKFDVNKQKVPFDDAFFEEVRNIAREFLYE